MRSRRRPNLFLAALASLATVALLAGCGGGGDDAASDDGIASLGTSPAAEKESPTTTAPVAADPTTPDDSVADTPTDSSLIDSGPPDSTGSADGTPSSDPEQAMLDYAGCMRENGIDMPDPEFTGDGGGMMVAQEVGAAEGDQPSQEEWEAADEECAPLMEAAVSNIEIDPEQEAEMRENMLAYAECMRENGIDMPDPEFGGNGQMTMSIGDADDGPDFDDEEFQAANEACGQDGAGIAISAGAPVGDD